MDNGRLRMENERTAGKLSYRCFLTLSIVNYPFSIGLIKLLQVHAAVQACHLLTVAVEHQRFAPAKFADTPLRGLGPARVIDFGVHVGVEAVFLRLHRVPRSSRLFFDEADFDDGFDALE